MFFAQDFSTELRKKRRCSFSREQICVNLRFKLFQKQEKLIMNYSCEALKLITEQKKEWEACGNGYASLSSVQVKTFQFDGYSIKVQYNPGRMTSTSAKVDPKSIKERKCFLCYNNLPKEQRGLDWKENYIILVNPFPIFPEHFTIPSKNHLPQEIKNSFKLLNELSYDLRERYTVFYNGPKCGASAPDHIHFQAGLKGFMPIEEEFETIVKKHGKVISEQNGLKVTGVDDGLRKFLAIESANSKEISDFFKKFLDMYSDSEEEPMLNVLSDFSGDMWRVVVFLRKKHRPGVYFAEGEERILLSPASVDVGGVCIVPREEDFDKITRENLTEIFHEVFITGEELESLAEHLAQNGVTR